MSWSDRRVLVTGAGGFIGSHLAEKLTEMGAQVRALVHYNSLDRRGWLDESGLAREMEVVAGDIIDCARMRTVMAGVSHVFHLAALIAIPYSYTAPGSYLRVNAEGTLNLLQAALEAGVERFVHTSTSETYGSARYVPIDEDHPLQAQSPYAASKIAGDKLAESFHRSFGLPVVTLRPFNTYGPRQSARAVIPTIVTQVLTGGPVRLGNLAPTRDFTFVSDTVRGFLAAVESPDAVGEVINTGSSEEIAIGKLVERIAARAGCEVKIEAEERRRRPDASEVSRLCAATRKAEELLGWRPEVDLDSGLERTIAWLGDHLDRYRPGSYTV